MLIELESGEVILFWEDQHYRPDDIMPDRRPARELVEAMTPTEEKADLKERFLTSKHRRSSRKPRLPNPPKPTLWARVPEEVKALIVRMAQERGMTLCAFTSELLERAAREEEGKSKPRRMEVPEQVKEWYCDEARRHGMTMEKLVTHVLAAYQQAIVNFGSARVVVGDATLEEARESNPELHVVNEAGPILVGVAERLEAVAHDIPVLRELSAASLAEARASVILDHDEQVETCCDEEAEPE